MTRIVRKIAISCMIGSLAFMAKPAIIQAATGEPIAGATILLDKVSLSSQITSSDILEQMKQSYEYSDLAIAMVNSYVNIRSKATTDSKVLGKLYNNSTAKILDIDNGWYKVESGTVTGYIKGNYLATGKEAEELVDKAYIRIAKVTAQTLNMRSGAGTNYRVVAKVTKGEELKVLEEQKNWTKVSYGNLKGYVSANYVNVKTGLKQAISIEEEKEAIKKAKQNSISSLRNRIANYALKFKGNPYVWGGTSLKYGADCSGFTQSVLKNFGIYIPRTSIQQAYSGRKVSLSNLQPGDIISYRKNGRVNHVAMYIGNGKVISASSRREGTVIKNYNYRKPYRAVSYID